jgi:hypothetical protein
MAIHAREQYALVEQQGHSHLRAHLLEIVGTFLPCPITLNPDLDTSKNHFLSSPKVDAKLHNITILNWIQPRLGIGLAKPNMVQEGARRTTHILDLPAAVAEAELAMLSADHLGLEANRGI